MVNYSDILYQRDFSGKTIKDAYLKACKWYASNIVSKVELADITVKYEKHTDSQYPTITMYLFSNVIEQEVHDRHCNICKETHSLFYMTDNINCSDCNMLAYHRRMQDISNEKKRYLLAKLKGSGVIV